MVKKENFTSAVYLTFSGDCKKALAFYHACFGGTWQLQLLEQRLPGYTTLPVVSGSLVSDRIIIHASDLVHDEGRKVGNNMAIFLSCKDAEDRKTWVKKLTANHQHLLRAWDVGQPLLEITDAFQVRWVLGI